MFAIIVVCALTWPVPASADRPFSSPDWTRPPNVSDGLAGKAWERGIPLRIGAAANGDGLDPATSEASYRQAVLDQYGIVGMETVGIANLAPTQSQFESGDYDWRVFDKVVSFACQNNMAVGVSPLFYDVTGALGGAAATLQSADGPTVDYWMNVHANRVMSHIRWLTGSQCPDIQIYVQVVNEGIVHQEIYPASGAHLWQKDNCYAQPGVCTRNDNDYTWLARAFSATQYYDNQARATYGGTRPAKLYYNENGAENYLDNALGTRVYNLLRAWKQFGWVIHGVGLQGHLTPLYVTNGLGGATQTKTRNTLNAYGALGFETQITEADYILPFKRATGEYWWFDDKQNGWNGECHANAAPGSSAFTPPNQPDPNDGDYNRHPAELVALFRACRDSNSCTAFITWGVFDHSNNGNAGYQCQNLGPIRTWAECQPDPQPEGCQWHQPVSGTEGYGHPVLLDCLSDGNGHCQNTGASYSYYRKRAWYWIWGAILESGPCGEANCVAPDGQYISHFTGSSCTGTESYYLPYDNFAYACRPWNGTGRCGTIRRTVTNRSYRYAGSCVHNAWPNGNTLSNFVTVYR